jgi:hypothetical protein
MPKELKDAFQPAHKLFEKPVIVEMHLVDKLIEVVFMTGTQVDKGLDSLVRVCRDILALASFDCADGIVNEHGEVGDAVEDVGGFIDANEGLVEDGEEVAEELECCGFFYELEHHLLVSLSKAKL